MGGGGRKEGIICYYRKAMKGLVCTLSYKIKTLRLLWKNNKRIALRA